MTNLCLKACEITTKRNSRHSRVNQVIVLCDARHSLGYSLLANGRDLKQHLEIQTASRLKKKSRMQDTVGVVQLLNSSEFSSLVSLWGLRNKGQFDLSNIAALISISFEPIGDLDRVIQDRTQKWADLSPICHRQKQKPFEERQRCLSCYKAVKRMNSQK